MVSHWECFVAEYLLEAALYVSRRYPKKADKGGEEGCSFSPRGSASHEREGRNIANLRGGYQRPDATEGWVMAAGGKEAKVKGKLPRRSPTARSDDDVRVSAKDGESYAEILKAMKARVDPQDSGAEVLSI